MINHRATWKMLAIGALSATLSAPANADVGDPCDVQARAEGASLYIKLDVAGLGTVMVENASIEAFGCQTRTHTTPDSGRWLTAPLGLIGWVKVLFGGQPLTFYETDVPVTVAGLDPGAKYWVSSAEVDLDEP